VKDEIMVDEVFVAGGWFCDKGNPGGARVQRFNKMENEELIKSGKEY
jgi:hypothetical protein